MANKNITAFSFLKEVRSELAQVVWPTREQAIKLTAIVIAVSIVVAIYISLLDLGFTRLVNIVLTN